MDRSLSQAAQRRLNRALNRTPMPDWMNPLGRVLLVVFGLFILYQVIAHPPGSSPATSVTTTTLPAGVVTTTLAPPASTTTTSPAHVPMVAVQQAGLNGTIDVPAAAARLAERAAVAEVTGNAAGIPRAPGSTPVPGSAVPYGAARVQAVQLAQGTTTSTQLSFLVTVSSGPAGQSATFAVNVVERAGAWLYTSA